MGIAAQRQVLAKIDEALDDINAPGGRNPLERIYKLGQHTTETIDQFVEKLYAANDKIRKLALHVAELENDR